MENISIGAGIFYGLLALSFVILIVKTRDRWKWGRIFAGIIGLPILAIGVIMGFEHYQHIPKPTLEFAGLTLNMPVDDVRFLRGEPSKISGTSKGGHLSMYPFRDYRDTGLIVSHNEEKVTAIGIIGDSDFSISIYGVFLGSEYKTVIDKLGETFQVKKHSEFYRSLYFKQYNVVIGIQQGRVIHLGIAINPDKYGWISVTLNQ
tara:strand:+ start:756 stop:1367 length:612 start_codon:yes stop_codon:yes gene_type:complete